MTSQQVMAKINAKIDASYKDKVEQFRMDPAKSDMIRRQIKSDKDAIAKSLVKFEGQDAAWSTSIVDEEFLPNNGESLLVQGLGLAGHAQAQFAADGLSLGVI